MALILKGNRKYPSIPVVNDDPRNHTQVLMAMKESLEIGQRRTTDLLNSFIRVQDLVDLGIIDIAGNTNAVVGADLSSIADLGDLSGAAEGDFLRFVSGEWVNDALALTDITQAMVIQHQAALSIAYSQITGAPTVGPDLSALTFMTEDDETADAPNSRQLLPGSNISFDDTVPGQRTINSSGGGGGGGGFAPALGHAGW